MHNSYVIPGQIDEAVVKKQAETRAADKRYPEQTMIHYHRHAERCNDKCYMFGQEKSRG